MITIINKSKMSACNKYLIIEIDKMMFMATLIYKKIETAVPDDDNNLIFYLN